VRDAATAGFLQSRISKGYRPAAAGRRGLRQRRGNRERLSELSAILLSLLGGAELQHFRSVGRPAGFRPRPRLAGEPVRSVDVRRQR